MRRAGKGAERGNGPPRGDGDGHLRGVCLGSEHSCLVDLREGSAAGGSQGGVDGLR